MSLMKDIQGICQGWCDEIFDLFDISGIMTSQIDFTAYPSLKTIVTDLQGAFQPTAYCIVVLFFLFSILDEGMNERFSFERFVKIFARLALGVGLIGLTDQIFTFGLNFSTELGGYISVTEFEKPQISETLNFVSLADAMTNMMLLFIVGKIAGLALAFAAYLTCFTRLIEIAVRGSFLPLAMAMASEDGWHGAAGRYFKKLVALFVQGPALLLICKLYNQIMIGVASSELTDSGGNIFSGLIKIVALGFATIGLAKQSINIINDVFGV